MISWLFPPESARRLLPDSRGRPTPYVIAIMTFVTIVIAAAGLALASAARVVSAGAEARISVQLPDGQARAPATLTAMRSLPGVAAAEPVPQEEVRSTLEQWLGPQSEAANLPIPVLIDVTTSPGANSEQIATGLQRAVPDARVSTYAEELAPLARSLGALQWLALGLIILMGTATSAAVVLAARGALDTNRATIEIMHGIGATDEQVTRLFQRRIAIDALLGGVGGAAAAALVLLLVLGPVAELGGLMTGGTGLRTQDIALLAAIPFLLAILATVVARVAVRRALRSAL